MLINYMYNVINIEQLLLKWYSEIKKKQIIND